YCSLLSCQPAAINRNGNPVNVIRRRRREKHRSPFQIVSVPPASHWNTCQNRGIASFVIAQGASIIGCHITGSNRIHVDAERSPLIRKRLRHVHDAVFGGGIGGDKDPPLI